MIGRTVAILVAAFAMAGQAVAATPRVSANGIASNRTALALGQGGSGGAAPVQGDEAAGSSGSHIGTLLILLGAIAAVGLGVAAAAGSPNHPPVSP